VVEGVDGLVLARDRAVVGDVEFGIFLDHVLSLGQRAAGAHELGQAQPDQGSGPDSDQTSSGSGSVFMSRLPAAPQHHFVRHRLPLNRNGSLPDYWGQLRPIQGPLLGDEAC